LTYNLKQSACADVADASDAESEFDRPDTIRRIAEALEAVGWRVSRVEATTALPQWLLTHAMDFVFNIAEGWYGPHREAQVPAILESLRIPFTGSSSTTLALALDKALTKQVLACEGIPTPPWQLFTSSGAPLNPALRFPLIVKPNYEGSSKGILLEGVVRSEAELRAQVARVIARYRQDALVEEFIDGGELTVGVLGEEALPVLEIDFGSCAASGEYFYSWRMKEFQGDAARHLNPHFHCPARLDGATTRLVQDLAMRAHRALGCREFSRTDIRLGAGGRPFVLEVNPLPGFSPLESNFPIMARAAGLSYQELIQRIVALAMVRYQRDSRVRIFTDPAPVWAGTAAHPVGDARRREWSLAPLRQGGLGALASGSALPRVAAECRPAAQSAGLSSARGRAGAGARPSGGRRGRRQDR